MANDVTGNPYILDSAGTNVVAGPIKISKIRWVPDAGSVDGATCLLKDTAGRTIWQSLLVAVGTAATAILPDESDFSDDLEVVGLTVTTITAGTICYVYISS